MTRFFKHPRAIERFRSGPLAGHIDRFAGLLFEQGYSRAYARKKLWLLRDLDRWLDRHGLRAAELDEGRLAEFARYRGSRGCRLKPGSGPMLKKFLAHLRDSGAAPAPAPILSRDANSLLERAFAEYLAKERGVCGATIDNYLHEISRFLAHRCRREPLSPSRIDAKTLNVFVLHRARQVGSRRAKVTVTALRSFCQFLRFRGDLTRDLSGANPHGAQLAIDLGTTITDAGSGEAASQVLRSADRYRPTQFHYLAHSGPPRAPRQRDHADDPGRHRLGGWRTAREGQRHAP